MPHNTTVVVGAFNLPAGKWLVVVHFGWTASFTQDVSAFVYNVNEGIFMRDNNPYEINMSTIIDTPNSLYMQLRVAQYSGSEQTINRLQFKAVSLS